MGEESIVYERAPAVGAGVTSNAAYPELRIVGDHALELREPEPLKEDVTFMHRGRGDGVVLKDQVCDLLRRAPPGIDTGIGRAQVCLPPPFKEGSNLLCRRKI